MDDASASAICIDSEEENDPPKQPMATPLHVFCRLVIPARSASKSRGQTKGVTVGDVWISQRARKRGADGSPPSMELEFSLVASQAAEVKAENRTAIVPTTVISQMAVRSEGRMIALKLHEPIGYGFFTEVAQGRLPSEFTLVPHRNEVHNVLAALRWWMPHVVVSGNVPMQLGGEGIVLRLDGLTLTVRDLMLLEDEQCLNDSVLDFFLRLALDVIAPDQTKGELYLASTFFSQKLTSGGVENGEQGWNNVRRWTRSLPGGFLGQKYVVLPINELNIHWWLAIICNARQGFDDSVQEESMDEMPRIVCLDSAVEAPLKGRTVAFLRGYLWKEWCERHGGADSLADAAEWSRKIEKVTGRLKALEADVPKQANSFDCGIFLIEYLIHLLKSEMALSGLGLATHKHWFAQHSVSHRRKRMKWLASLLVHEAKRRSQPDVGKLMEEDQRLRQAVAKGLTDLPKKVPKAKRHPNSDETSQRRTVPRVSS